MKGVMRYLINDQTEVTINGTMSVQLLKLGFNVIIWTFVPLIVLIILYFTRLTAKRADDKKYRDAMKAGFWAGFILFVMVLIYQVGIFIQEGFPSNDIFQGFNIWWALLSALFGFFIFMAGHRAASPRLAGLEIMAVVFLSTYTFIHYLFIRTWNEIVLSAALGVAFGVLAYFACFPGSVRKALGS